MNSFIMTNARVLQQHGEHNGCDIVVEKGVIKGITPPGLSSPDTELPTIDLAGQYIATAPIEFHIHGAGPFGFEMDQPDILEKGVCFLQDRGVGWVMPTLAFSEPPLLRLVDELEAKPWLQDVVPGIYLEGPFINSKKRGGIQMHMIAPPDPDHLRRILELGKGFVKMMTFAPEMPGADKLLPVLREYNVIPCLGHSLATAEQSAAILDGGTFNTTHLFNAMSGLSHKEIGMAGLPFLNSGVYYELNGDLVHVAREMLQLCSTSLAPERRVLITDAVISAGLDYGEYQYFDHAVESSAQGVRYLQSGTLIGSNRLIFDVIRSMRAVTGEPLHQLWNSVTTVPFELLQLKNAAPIQPDTPARLVAFDSDFHVTDTWCFPGKEENHG